MNTYFKIQEIMNLSPGLLDILFNLVNFDSLKTRRGSPVDDRPSTDKLHNFVQKKNNKKITNKKNKKNVTHDTFGGGEHALKISAP